jgi:RNA polymerase sigma factor (sigma-70 family)
MRERFRDPVRQVMDVDAEDTISLTEPTDRLLRAAASTERSGSDLDEIFRNHRRRLVSLAFAITLDAAAAEEVVQDAFVGVHERIASIDDPIGYLQRSVVNLSVSLLRRRRFSTHRPLRHEEPAASSPEIEEMWSRVIRLPVKQRAVVVLRFWEDLSIAEIARVLGRPTGSIKSTLHRALRSLREELT